MIPIVYSNQTLTFASEIIHRRKKNVSKSLLDTGPSWQRYLESWTSLPPSVLSRVGLIVKFQQWPTVDFTKTSGFIDLCDQRLHNWSKSDRPWEMLYHRSLGSRLKAPILPKTKAKFLHWPFTMVGDIVSLEPRQSRQRWCNPERQ